MAVLNILSCTLHPYYLFILGFPGGSMIKNSPANAGDKKHRLDPWVGNIPWRRKWQPTPVFLPGKSHGQRSLVGYSLWGQKKKVRHDLETKQQQLTYLLIGSCTFCLPSSNSLSPFPTLITTNLISFSLFVFEV